MTVGISVAEARAPYVAFERRPMEDRAASIEKGIYTTKDVDFAIITPQGSKDQIERVAEEWLAHIDQEALTSRFPREWAKAYKFAFKEWKEGREIPVDGTAIANWGVPSPAQRDAMRQLKIRTVEDMAAANEETIHRLGMGGIQLRKFAQDFLQAAKDGGPAKLAAQIADMQAQLNTLSTTNGQLLEANAMLKADLARAAPQAVASHVAEQAAQNGNSIGASDLLDDDRPDARPAPAGLKKL